ncbi:MAG: hypothetical protein KBD73_02040 [Candidatus Magasanikbacteria bacterium]|nr:hypothetical protein [Candidatus Magasanikbacteria bacterium]
MPNFDPQPFHLFRAHEREEVASAFVRLLKAKSTLLERGISGVPKIYEYAEPLARTLGTEAGDNSLLIIAHELIYLIDPLLIDAFILQPEEKDTRDALSLQLFMVAIATGDSKKDDFTPYSLEELASIVLGDTYLYDDIIFVRTLRAALVTTGDGSYAKVLAEALPALTAEFADVEKEYEWDDVFFLSFILHVVWKGFVLLGRNTQERLLQNYFYLAIVAGVPVRRWLSEILHIKSAAVDTKELSIIFNQSLANNRETVPMNTGVEEGRPFVDLEKEFFAKIYSENISTLAEVQFVDSFYVNQPSRDIFSAWLREALSISLHVKKGDL